MAALTKYEMDKRLQGITKSRKAESLRKTVQRVCGQVEEQNRMLKQVIQLVQTQQRPVPVL